MEDPTLQTRKNGGLLKCGRAVNKEEVALPFHHNHILSPFVHQISYINVQLHVF